MNPERARVSILRVAKSILKKAITTIRALGGKALSGASNAGSRIQVALLSRNAALAAFRTIHRHPSYRQRAANLLLTSGLFDLELYLAQQPDSPTTLSGAVEHFLTVGMPQLATFHPAIMPGYLPPHIQRHWRAANLGLVFGQLGNVRGLHQSWAPWFHPGLHVEIVNDAPRREAFVATMRFLQDLNDQTWVQPDPALTYRKPQRWKQIRDESISVANRHTAQRALHRPRWSTEWNHQATKQWIAALANASLPESATGPAVSVIMPAWNRAGVIATAIKSVQQQTFQAWELLVVDDGSEDDTAAVVSELAATDTRIRLVGGNHSGVCAARNLGIEQANGEFVAFLDTDNTWRPRFLELSLKAMHRGGFEFAYCGSKIDGDGNPTRYRGSATSLEELQLFNHVDLNVLIVGASLLRRVGGFDPDLRRWVDHDLAIRLAAVVTPEFLPFIGCDYYNSNDGLARITTSEADYWQYVVLGKAWCDWDAAAATERVPGRVSVVMPIYNDVSMTVAAVTAVLEHSTDHDLEVIAIDNGSRSEVSLALAAAFSDVPRVQLHRLPMNLNFGIGSNIGVLRSTGELILFLNNDTLVQPGWLAPLVQRLADPEVAGVQPLLVYQDGAIQSAGTIFPTTLPLPTHFLTGFPPDDGRRVGDYRFSAVTAAALLMRASEVIALKGFDAAYSNGSEDVDLCLRFTESRGGYFAVEPRSIVTHLESRTPGRGARIAENREFFVRRWAGRTPRNEDHYQRHGFEIAHIGVDQLRNPAPKLILRRTPPDPAALGEGQHPVLRWGIRNPATAGPSGDRWGDTHFCGLLADALRSVGQEAVVTRRLPAVDLSMAYDDVSVVIRGLWRVSPQPGKTNVLWVISHPDLVTVDELAEFDVVFAASPQWAKAMTELSGREVLPLLQATDPALFAPGATQQMPCTEALFVGQARADGTPRQIVMDAIAADLPLEVWGPRWESLIDGRYLRGEYLRHDQLPAKYRAASVVLNDHWPDMAYHGFLSNRLFDAVASGARVVSDQVEGLDELFAGAVQTYSSLADLSDLCSPGGIASRFPSADELAKIAADVGQRHSFAARAATMVEEVLRVRRST